MDLKGNIIVKTQIEKPRSNVKEIVDCILQITREVIKRSKEYSEKIRGIGIGVAGLVNKKDGMVYWPQKLGENYVYASVNLPLRELIEKEFSLPVSIENDATDLNILCIKKAPAIKFK